MTKALWAATGFCILYALQITLQSQVVRGQVDPIQLIFLLNTFAFLFLTVLQIVTNRNNLIMRAPPNIVSRFLVATILWIAADVSAVIGLLYSSSLNLSILSRLQLFITYVGAVLFLKEGLTARKAAALVIASAGSILTVYNGQALHFGMGDLLFLVFTVAISISGLMRQKLGELLDFRQITHHMFGVGSLLTGIYVYIAHPLTTVFAIGTVLLIALLMVLGFLAVNYSIIKGGATQFSLVSSLLPFVTAVFAYIILKETPSIYQILGGAIIVYGIVLFVKKN